MVDLLRYDRRDNDEPPKWLASFELEAGEVVDVTFVDNPWEAQAVDAEDRLVVHDYLKPRIDAPFHELSRKDTFEDAKRAWWHYHGRDADPPVTYEST